LNNALEVKIRLSMTDQIYFFAGQFVSNLAPKIRKYFVLTSFHSISMSIFNSGITLESLAKMSSNTMVEHLGIEFTTIGGDFLEARMPVDHRTHQPLGLLHGGASLALAETLGSMAAACCLDMNLQYCVGIEINANHIKSVKTGFVYGTARPLHIGKKTHVWEIKIVNEQKALVCISRITLAVIDKQ
jgi:1,4-dihydroxy-2-naphthoyl-CoA hydrolase